MPETAQAHGKSAGPSGPGFLTSVLVFAFGAAAGLLLAFAGAGLIESSAALIVTVFLAALTVIGLVALLIFAFRGPILKRLFGYADTQVELFADPIARIAQGALARDAETATAAARDLVGLGLARYAWISTRRWIVTSLAALIAAMAALAGTALLFRQNTLLEAQTALLSQQNDKIEVQSDLLSRDVELAEATRNAALAIEITDIAALIGAAAAAAADRRHAEMRSHGEEPDPMRDTVNVLDVATEIDRALQLRIVSASRAARPYRFLLTGVNADDDADKLRIAMAPRATDLPGAWGRLSAANGWRDGAITSHLTDRPASPERGQLLQLMVAGGLRDLQLLNAIGLDLSFAYMPGAELVHVSAQGGTLSFSDLTFSDIRLSDFGGSYLENTRFDGSRILWCQFASLTPDRASPALPAYEASTFLAGASFTRAAIMDTRFDNVAGLAVNFDQASLFRVSFAGAVLGAGTFRDSLLADVDFAGADLKSVDFDGAIVFGEDFLDLLAAAALPGRFVAASYRLEPATPDELEARIPALLDGEEFRAYLAATPAFRMVRVRPLED